MTAFQDDAFQEGAFQEDHTSDIKTTFTVIGHTNSTLKTVFSVIRPYKDLKTGFNVIINTTSILKTVFNVVANHIDLPLKFKVQFPGPPSTLKTVFTVLKPHADLSTKFEVIFSESQDLKTRFCVRRPHLNLKTTFSVTSILNKVLSTIFTVKRSISLETYNDLKTKFTVNPDSSANTLQVVFYVEGIYKQTITLNGTILHETVKSAGSASEGARIIIGDDIYV